MTSIIKDPSLVDEGRVKVEWARDNMPALREIYTELKDRRPFEGYRISLCLHITKETGVFVEYLKLLGAEVSLAASNPLSTQDDVAAYLSSIDINVYGWRGMSKDDYYRMLASALDIEPDLVVDDGGDIHSLIHSRFPELASNIIGGTEETTTGVIRLKALESENKLRYPVIAVNDTPTKRVIDNRFGSGQSTVDGFLRATSLLIAGKTVVVAGYGYVGRGVASRFRGLGAKVIVTEVDPLKALEAYLDGFMVMKMSDASQIGDIFITCTGMKDVIRKEHIEAMKDGVFLANAGHFNVEIDVKALEMLSLKKRLVRPYIEEYVLKDGRRIYLIGEGRLINLVAAEGHPPDVMMASFSNQLLSLLYLLESGSKMERQVYNVPKEIDEKVAKYLLKGWNINIDVLTEEQKKYWRDWRI
ncbi:MAG TPA: adenosylhomocysteinase [Thermoprotei archaeon]|nr:adenosylhomocysteinase [Thermoprotei archaeon]